LSYGDDVYTAPAAPQTLVGNKFAKATALGIDVDALKAGVQVIVSLTAPVRRSWAWREWPDLELRHVISYGN
jgi:hypothetical protein